MRARPVNGNSTTQARGLCTAMKAKGIEIYTRRVRPRTASRSASYQMLQEVRIRRRKFYNADDGEELKLAFRDIALKLSQLHLSK